LLVVSSAKFCSPLAVDGDPIRAAELNRIRSRNWYRASKMAGMDEEQRAAYLAKLDARIPTRAPYGSGLPRRRTPEQQSTTFKNWYAKSRDALSIKRSGKPCSKPYRPRA
jgi:hypothetical protein